MAARRTTTSLWRISLTEAGAFHPRARSASDRRPPDPAVAGSVAGKVTPRQRVLAALAHQETDRVPIDLGSTWISTTTIPFYEKLKRHFGVEAPTRLMERNMQVCHIDE